MGIHLAIHQAIAWITLDNPVKLNCLNDTMFSQLEAALDRLDQLPEVRVIILASQGSKAFCSGRDLQEKGQIQTERNGPIHSSVQVAWAQRIFQRIAHSKRPVIASINGVAFGAGLELALACHLRIASETASFAFPEVKLGLIPAFGGFQRLSTLVGKGMAYEMLLTGLPIPAQRAHAIGLINRLTSPLKLREECENYASIILQNAPLAVQAILEGMKLCTEPDPFPWEGQTFDRLIQTRDAREGLEAFLEKRKPDFIGS